VGDAHHNHAAFAPQAIQETEQMMSIPFWDERTFPVNEQRWLGCGVVFCGRYRGSLASAGGCGEVSQGIGMSVASHSCFVAA
jgi:hypothetical protein